MVLVTINFSFPSQELFVLAVIRIPWPFCSYSDSFVTTFECGKICIDLIFYAYLTSNVWKMSLKIFHALKSPKFTTHFAEKKIPPKKSRFASILINFLVKKTRPRNWKQLMSFLIGMKRGKEKRQYFHGGEKMIMWKLIVKIDFFEKSPKCFVARIYSPIWLCMTFNSCRLISYHKESFFSIWSWILGENIFFIFSSLTSRYGIFHRKRKKLYKTYVSILQSF